LSPLANQGTFTDVTIIDSCLISQEKINIFLLHLKCHALKTSKNFAAHWVMGSAG
jgi:hypothetical protein